MSRVRWGNVAQLAGVVAAAVLIAFGPRGCSGSEPETIPLDALPGDPVAIASAPPAPPRRVRSGPVETRPPRDQRRRRPRPARRRVRLSREVVAPSVSVVRRTRIAPRRLWPQLPEAAREFSFDR